MKKILFFSILILTACTTKVEWKCVEGNCENGQGKKLWPDGGYDKGNWVNGELNGSGMQFYGSKSDFSGDTYTGQYEDYAYNGFGTYCDKSEDSKYVGQFKDGKPNGSGKATWGKNSRFPNRYYDGQWKDGLMHGRGTKFWGIAEEDQYTNNKYTGEWVNDQKEGFGKYEWADGSYYEGYWKNDDQQGKGIYVFADGEVFKGIWDEGYCQELAKKLGLE